MNVLHICDYASPVSGNFIAELNAVDAALKKEGGKIIYALTDRNIERKNHWVDELKNEHTVYIYDSNPLKKIKLIRKIIKKEKADILHIHFTDLKTDICIRLAAFGQKVKFIKHYRSGYGIWKKLKMKIGKTVYKNWSYICITSAMADECKINFPLCGNRVILNPIAFERLDKFETVTKEEITGSDSGILCLMVGYNYKLKGIDIASDAVSKLRNRHNIYLAICVTTHLEEIQSALSEQFGGAVPEWIKFLPPREDIASYYRAADICLAPSRSEGACSAIVEEAYCGKVVVASDCAGQLSYAKDMLDILWFKNKSSDDLKDKIEKAISLKDNYSYAEENRKNAVKYYGLTNYTEQVLQMYKDLLK